MARIRITVSMNRAFDLNLSLHFCAAKFSVCRLIEGLILVQINKNLISASDCIHLSKGVKEGQDIRQNFCNSALKHLYAV